MMGDINNNDTIYTVESITTTFFDKKGYVDSTYLVIPKIDRASKFYFRDFRPFRSQASYIENGDTLLISTSEYSYKVLNKSPLIIESTELIQEDDTIMMRMDTTLFDISDYSSSKKIPNGTIYKTYYKDHWVVGKKISQNGRDESKTEYKYENKLLIEQVIYGHSAKSIDLKLKVVYPKYDIWGNWIEQLYIPDGEQRQKTAKVERVIEYWK